MAAGLMSSLRGSSTSITTGSLSMRRSCQHSYLFGYAIPFTHVGVLGAYSLNEKWAITGGITCGWDQATDDNNGAIDGIGQIKWTPNPKWTFYLNAITGPEQTDNNTDYRT